jgi:hypothetical protein
MTGFYGWSPPPRPLYVPPSFEPSDPLDVQKWKIILDWFHDDDLYNFITGGDAGALLWQFGGTPAKINPVASLPVDTLAAFYFLGPAPSADALAAFQESSYTVGDTFMSQWSSVWAKLNDIIVNKVIPKRAFIGPLPTNVFSDETGNLNDPVVIYYYDDKWLKRVSYPLALVQMAATQNKWWSLSAGDQHVAVDMFVDVQGNPTSSADPMGMWTGEGWDIKQGSNTIDDVLKVVVAAISALLALTGAGAFVSALFLAIATIVEDIVSYIENSISGGNAAGALLGIGQAILAVGSAELTKFSPAIQKLGATGIKMLGGTLTSMGKNLDPTYNPNLEAALEKLKSTSMTYGPMTRDHFNVILSILSGQQAIGQPIAQAGWDMAQYATTSDLAGIAKVYGYVGHGPTSQALFTLGAQLGTLAKAQREGKGLMSPYSALGAGVQTGIHMVPLTPMTDLMNYVRTTLQPRYHL